MRRVSVVGTTGAGKTTFARELSGRLGVPHVELDALFWGPRWTMAEREVFRARSTRATADDAWVVDGDYSALVRDLIWSRADTVVWLDYSLWRIVWQLVPRIIARIRDQQELWPGTGNRESVRSAILTKDPLVWFAIRTHHRRRRRLAEGLALPVYEEWWPPRSVACGNVAFEMKQSR